MENLGLEDVARAWCPLCGKPFSSGNSMRAHKSRVCAKKNLPPPEEIKEKLSLVVSPPVEKRVYEFVPPLLGKKKAMFYMRKLM